MRLARATALAAILLLTSCAASASASAASPRTLNFALVGYQGKAPVIQFQIDYETQPSRARRIQNCPARCSIAFGPGTGVRSPLRYRIMDTTASTRAFTSYLSGTGPGPAYTVVSYGSCQQPQVRSTPTSCTGTASRSGTVAIRLEYRPLVSVLAVGSINDPRPTSFYTGVSIRADPPPGPDDETGPTCEFKIEAVNGNCRRHISAAPTTVRVPGSGGFKFLGFGPPCAGQDTGAPSRHECTFTPSDDVTITAAVEPANPGRTAPLNRDVPQAPKPRPPFGPFLSDFQSNPPGEAMNDIMDALFDTYYGKGKVSFLFEVAAFKLTGLTIRGLAPGGATGRAASAGSVLLRGSLRTTADGLFPLTVNLTPAGKRLFAKAGRHRITVSAVLDPPTGPNVSRTRTGSVRS